MLQLEKTDHQSPCCSQEGRSEVAAMYRSPTVLAMKRRSMYVYQQTGIPAKSVILDAEIAPIRSRLMSKLPGGLDGSTDCGKVKQGGGNGARTSIIYCL